MSRAKKDEKLLNLLNEYEQNDEERRRIRYGNGAFGFSGAFGFAGYSQLLLVSKQYGFISRLVENKKINRAEVRSEGYTRPTYGFTKEPYTTGKSILLENTILMILSIHDEPIHFLESILK